MSSGQDFTLEYNISSPAQASTYPYPLLDVTPSDCAQAYTYEIVFAGTQDQPSFATITPIGIQILTDDPNDVQLHDLELLITPNGLNEVGTIVVPYSLQVLGCIFDEVTVGTPIGSVVYQINSGVATIEGDFENLYATDCPFDNEYSLVQVGYAGPGDYDPAIFTFSSNSPIILIESSDTSLSDKFFTLELTGTAAQTSGSSDVDIIDIEFTIGCDDAVLDPPTFTETSIVIDLFEENLIDFAAATSSKPSCGAITY